MKNNYNQTTEHLFIVVHAPVYSTASGGSKPYFANKMTTFLDDHKEKNRAVFSGHYHLFNAFKRKKVFIFVNAVAGGDLTNMRIIVLCKQCA